MCVLVCECVHVCMHVFGIKLWKYFVWQVQEARHNHDEELVKKTVEEYDETLEW